jgi:hypothetical protein
MSEKTIGFLLVMAIALLLTVLTRACTEKGMCEMRCAKHILDKSICKEICKDKYD